MVTIPNMSLQGLVRKNEKLQKNNTAPSVDAHLHLLQQTMVVLARITLATLSFQII